jgi:hypothetical protein
MERSLPRESLPCTIFEQSVVEGGAHGNPLSRECKEEYLESPTRARQQHNRFVYLRLRRVRLDGLL